MEELLSINGLKYMYLPGHLGTSSVKGFSFIDLELFQELAVSVLYCMLGDYVFFCSPGF